jgi:uncharacterized YccA/Bax inhibitor family protein
MTSGFAQVYGAAPSTVMTVQGAFGKTCGLLAILSATALWSWAQTRDGELSMIVLPASMIIGLVFALITTFKPSFAPWTAPLYAAFEGVFLGSFSFMIESMHIRGAYPGIAIQAVSLTAGTLLMMLFIYMTGLIRVTDKLRMGIVAATGAVCMVYFVAVVMSFFGKEVGFLYQGSAIGIGFSVIVVGIAAFNLLLDFDSIEQMARSGAPKYMEWYGAFGLMVTLVWLYLEIIRLLSKLNSRR